MFLKIAILSLVAFAALFFPQLARSEETKSEEKTEVKKSPQVLLKTSMGDITIELNSDKAPVSVENFLGYVKDKQYDNTIFHRVIKGFMVQGGGFTPDFKQKPTLAPIINEADNGLKNTRGTLAMARTSDPNSATSQFFINLVDNPFLDFKSPTSTGWGYAVFGKVVDGMDVVDKMAKAKTGNYQGHQDVPLDPIVILEAKQL